MSLPTPLNSEDSLADFEQALISGFTDMVTTSQVFFEQNLDTATIQDETDATSVLNAFRGVYISPLFRALVALY